MTFMFFSVHPTPPKILVINQNPVTRTCKEVFMTLEMATELTAATLRSEVSGVEIDVS